MKEYKVFEISKEAEDTEEELNKLAGQGWKLVCSYAEHNFWLIMEKEKGVKE